MEYKQAIVILRQTATDEDLKQKIELQSRYDLPEIILKGYFDPMLVEIQAACETRKNLLIEASMDVAERFKMP